MPKAIKHKSRDIRLDVIRLIAILAMLLAHTIAYVYHGGGVLIFARDWINIVSFTTFLFVSGTVIYLAYLKDFQKHNLKAGNIVKRMYMLLFGYYILAFSVSSYSLLAKEFLSGAQLQQILKIFLLIEVPGYTEFLLPFVFYSLLILLVPGLLKNIAKDPILILFAATVVYTLGGIASNIGDGFNSPFYEWGSLFWGSANNYRFPVLQYLPVLLIGIHWGQILSDGKEDKQELKRESYLMVLILAVAAVVTFLYDSDTLLKRWPPSVAFLGIGLAWVGLLVVLNYRLKLTSNILKAFYEKIALNKLLATNPLLALIVHTLIVTIISRTVHFKTGNALLVLIIYLGTIVLTAGIILLLKYMATTLKVKNPSILLFLITILITLSIGTYGLLDMMRGETDGKPNPAIDKADTSKYYYWADQYSPRKLSLNIEAEEAAIYNVSFNHLNLVAQNFSRADGKDFRVYARTEEMVPTEISYALAAPNTPTTSLQFMAEPGKTYEVYLGGNFTEATKADFVKPVSTNLKVIDVAATATIASPIKLKSLRYWHVKNDSLQLTAEVPEGLMESDVLSYQIWNPNDLTTLPVVQQDIAREPAQETITLDIPLDSLEYGSYYVRIHADLYQRSEEEFNELGKSLQLQVADGEINSPLLPFKYSAPVYMTWTIDWEGYDLKQEYMNQLVGMVDQYRIPMTHYFNPRIYTNPAVSKDKAKYLTSWVKQRANKGDEIGLHLHMHHDLVAAAGLEPKTEPAWGGRLEGHDVLTTAYDYQEFSQILDWSLKTFKDNGLPKPSGYRAGGWFLDMDNMRALNDAGFVYDTSGSDYREPYGPNKQPREWRLSATQKPYQVSSSSINSSKPPLLKIWEYPNNGADSTNRTAQELIRRFNLNFQYNDRGVITEAQVLTYLTHPHWLYIDAPKLTQLFEYSKNYTYHDDHGPLIYTTQIDAHNKYTEIIK